MPLTGGRDADRPPGIQCGRGPDPRVPPPGSPRRRRVRGRASSRWGMALHRPAERRSPCTARRWPSRPRGTASSYPPGGSTPSSRDPGPRRPAGQRVAPRGRGRLARGLRSLGATWPRRGDDLLRSALLDLRALSVGLPVSVAGWTDRWRYAWPRDVSFVVSALARAGHPEHAAASSDSSSGSSGRRLVRGPLRHHEPPARPTTGPRSSTAPAGPPGARASSPCRSRPCGRAARRPCGRCSCAAPGGSSLDRRTGPRCRRCRRTTGSSSRRR